MHAVCQAWNGYLHGHVRRLLRLWRRGYRGKDGQCLTSASQSRQLLVKTTAWSRVVELQTTRLIKVEVMQGCWRIAMSGFNILSLILYLLPLLFFLQAEEAVVIMQRCTCCMYLTQMKLPQSRNILNKYQLRDTISSLRLLPATRQMPWMDVKDGPRRGIVRIYFM